MFWFTIVLVIVNFFFLALGVLLTDYAQRNGIDAHKDELFPILATQGNLGTTTEIFFVLGLIAAAYSSADSALTSLTTAFCVDFLGMHKQEKSTDKATRLKVHVAFSLIIILVVCLFDSLGDESVISNIFRFAGYTYGPLLGLFIFGLFTKFRVRDKFIPMVCLVSPVLTYLASAYSPDLIGYTCLLYTSDAADE